MTDIRSWEDYAEELGRIEREQNFRGLPQNATNQAHCSRSYPGMDSTGVNEARLPRVPSWRCSNMYYAWIHALYTSYGCVQISRFLTRGEGVGERQDRFHIKKENKVKVV